MKNIQIISDNNSKSLKIKKSLLKYLTILWFKKPNISIVINCRWIYASNIKKKSKKKNNY